MMLKPLHVEMMLNRSHMWYTNKGKKLLYLE